MRRNGPLWGAIIALGAVAWLVYAPHVSAAGGVGQATPATPSAGVNDLLGPVLAAATGVERIVEMGWGIFESLAGRFIAVLGMGRSWAGYAHDEVQSANTEINQVAAAIARLRHTAPAATPGASDPTVPADPQGLALLAAQMDVAQQRLSDAQQQLSNALQSATYVSFKRAISIFAGLVLGVSISGLTGMNLFQLLRLPSDGGFYGVLVTGLIIGAGSGPVHSIIGLIQQARDATDQAANLFASRSKRNAAETVVNLLTANAAAMPPTTDQTGPEGAMRDLPPDGVREAPPAGPVAAPPARITQEQLRAIERMARR